MKTTSIVGLSFLGVTVVAIGALYGTFSHKRNSYRKKNEALLEVDVPNMVSTSDMLETREEAEKYDEEQQQQQNDKKSSLETDEIEEHSKAISSDE